MKQRVLFQLVGLEGEEKGLTKEVMNVDLMHWNALRKVVKSNYRHILAYIQKDFPIHMTRQQFLDTEGEMREIDLRDLNEDAYVAHFSLDIFIRQLDELSEADIIFDLN